MRPSLLCASLLLAATTVNAEVVTVATYNVERWQEAFPKKTSPATMPGVTPEAKEAIRELEQRVIRKGQEDNWQVAMVMQSKEMNPDVIVFQECCDQKNLEHFNKRDLKGAYATVIVFPTNTERDQNVAMMLKPGFKVVETRDDYYKEPDPVGNDRGGKLFARGPAFVEIESPKGQRFWVGTNHMKSKSGNSLDVTKWRNREAVRIHQIMKEIAAVPDGGGRVVFLGDMNDELGMQEFEQQGGGDTIANLLGPPEDGFVLATKPLVDAGKISFGGYESDRYRSFIDHVFVSANLKDSIKDIHVVTDGNGVAKVASDHYPVVIQLDLK